MDEELQKFLQKFAKDLEGKVRNSASKYGFSDKIKVKVKKMGDDFKLSIELPRYSIMRHKGVGKGRGIKSGKTTPDEFLNRIMNEEMPNLSAIVAKHYSDAFINMSKTLIK
jgi:hypothetical protein